MKTLKQFLLSRKVVLTLILLILAAVVAGYIFPQKFTSTNEQLEKWHEAHPYLTPWIGRLGLDHIYTTPWFSAILLIFLITLMLSTIEQIKISYTRSFGQGISTDAEGFRVAASREDIIREIKNAGYGVTHQGDSYLRFIRHRWGYWGNALLHAGMAVVIASSLTIVLTEKRGLMHFIEGETFLPGSEWLLEDTGMLGGRFVLPDAVRLEQSNIEFWETDEVKYQTTVFSLIGADGKETRHTVGINLNVVDKGVRIYQGRDFGYAFYVTLTGPEGKEFKYIFQLEHPLKRDKASYRNFTLKEVPYLLKTKYYADAGKKSIESGDPLLVMRLVQTDMSVGNITQSSGEGGRLKMDIVEKEKVFGEVSLKIGERKPFGPYTAELVHVAKWTGLIFTRNTGMPGIFAGFLIIIVGGALTYFMPPREILAKKEGSGFNLIFKASRFRSLYEDEFEKIREKIGGAN